MTTYKLRLFYKPIVCPRRAGGKISIKEGSKDYILDLLKEKMDECIKVIIEVV